MSAAVKRIRRDSAHEALSHNLSKRLRPVHDSHGDGQTHSQRLSYDDYRVGWICALPIEMAAARAMLDEVHDCLPNRPNDENTYTLGSICQHNAVIVCLPSGGYGTNNAAIVASNMYRSFPSLSLRFMVGIGGGVPGKTDVRLGDVVVGSMVVQYDIGKASPHGFQKTGIQRLPPYGLLTAISKLRANHESNPSTIPTILSEMCGRHPSMTRFIRQDSLQDRLFDSSYDHIEVPSSCDSCDESKLLDRHARSGDSPVIHYGVIASGNQVMKHAKTRDQLAEELGAICFEMEAAGLMEPFPCLVIRGICDYADSHKNKQWQEYAAATAAAYAKELLSVTPTIEIQMAPAVALDSTIEQIHFLDRRKALLESLNFESIESRYVTIKTANAKTCQWLLQHPDFVAWLNPHEIDQHHGFLWISGKPGAGKSTLMKFGYNHATKKAAENETIISFFFNARGDDLEKSVVGMYRSLLLQLLMKLPDLQEVLDDPNLVSRSGDNCPTWQVELLHGLLSAAISKLGQRRLVCFVDALDECGEREVRTMKENFENLGENTVETGVQLHICFSSRHYPYIDIQHGRQLVLEDQTGHGQDLERFVQNKLRLGTSKEIQKIRKEILERATGIFMWVVLVVDILNKEFERGRIFAVRKRLQEIPNELHQLFRDVLTRDNDNMDDLLLCIQWILYAKQPLKPIEFYFALVSGLNPEAENLEWKHEYISLDDVDRFVLSSSKGLAEITKSKGKTVQFIHESVSDFLVKDNGIRDLWPEFEGDFRNSSNDRLKHCCHAYIEMIDVSNFQLPEDTHSRIRPKEVSERLSERFPFLEYATRNVLHHADAAALSLSQDDFLENFASKSWKRFNKLFQIFETRIYWLDASLLYILAENNWAELIRARCRRDPSIQVRGGRYHYPLFAALTKGHRHAVRALLQQDTCLSGEDDISAQLEYGPSCAFRKDQTPLLWASEKGHTALTKHLLMSQDSNFELKDKNGQTSLSLAAKNGYEAIAQLLLGKGADFEIRDKTDLTPLLWAAKNGHDAVVRLLLDNGADFETRDNTDLTPLLWAAKNGHDAVVRLLLANGADPEEEANHKTSLSLAAENSHNAIVFLLLDKGASLETKVWSSYTPLLWAASEGHEDLVRLLLDKGANVEAEGYYGETALSDAAAMGHEAIVRLLLDRNAKIETQEINNRTPLSLAMDRGHAAVIRVLLDKGANFNVWSPFNHGNTPLSWAVRNGHEDIVRLLLDRGADFKTKEVLRRTLLSLAAGEGHEAIVRLLLDKGADVKAEDADHQTPLLWAIKNGHEAIIRLLIDRGANIET